MKPLPPETRLQLIAMIAQDLASTYADEQTPVRCILELEGLGAEIWSGIDVQEYVDELRDEWEREV